MLVIGGLGLQLAMSTPVYAKGGILTNTNVQPASLVAGAIGTTTISFTTANAIPADGRIWVTFDSNFDLSAASSFSCSTMGGGEGTFSLFVGSAYIIATRQNDGASIPAGSQVCTVDNIRNPYITGDTVTYGIATQTSGSSNIDSASVAADFILGQGTAQIDGGGGTASNLNIQRGTSAKFSIIVVVGADGITADADSPIFTIPDGLTAPEAAGQATSGAVDTNGEWYVGASGGTCAITMASSGASGQNVTADVTGDCVSGDSIVLVYQGKSDALISDTPVYVRTSISPAGGVATRIESSPTVLVYDNSFPTVSSIVSSSPNPSKGGSIEFTVTFSEDVTGFDENDVRPVETEGNVKGGPGMHVVGSGSVYTVTIDDVVGEGKARIDILDDNSIIDVASNPFRGWALGDTYTAGQEMTIDSVSPTVALTSDVLDPKDLLKFSVTSTFSEDVSGFTLDDITILNGVASNFVTTTADTVYTFDITPSGQGLVTIQVLANSGYDVATNGNEDSNIIPTTVDTIPPSDPVITPAAGAYSSAQSIFISSAGSNSIRYTTNGSEPSCSAGTSYAGSFALASTASVKAIGCDLAKNASNVTTNAYTISAGGGGNSSNNNPNIGGSGGLALLSGPTIFQIYYNGQYLTKAQYDALFPQAAPEVQPPAQTEVPQPASVPDSASKPSLQNPSLLTTAQLLAVFDLTPNPEEESKILPLVGADAKEFGLVLSDALARATRDFIVYGISPNTIKSGEGERRAIIRDYMDTVGRDYFVWSDIEKITNGQIPVKRSIEKERAMAPEALKAFRHAFGHDPDFKNTKENLAWNTMMYRIRFPRELAKEQQGIIAFYKTYGHNPKTPFDWSVVRVLGYVI